MPKTSKARVTAARPAAMPRYRPSCSWTPAEDQTLMAAHAKGMTWKPISETHFPNKSPNACRKRHERLMSRRHDEDWDGINLERLAIEYMRTRKEIWSPLAEAVGEKWQFVEAKCMEKGLSNLTSTARGANRRSSGMSYMDEYYAKDDDSGIAMEDEAEMEAGRRRQSAWNDRQQYGDEASSSAGGAPGTDVRTNVPAGPVIQQPPPYYQYHGQPQSLNPSPQSLSSQPSSSGLPPSTSTTRAMSYGPTIASLLSPTRHP